MASSQVAVIRALGHALLALWLMVSWLVFIVVNSSAHLLEGVPLMVAWVAYVAGNSAHAISVAATPSSLTVSSTAPPPPT